MGFFFFNKLPFAAFFAPGATIVGSPYLWLPLPAAPPRIGRARTTPRRYIEQIGPLHFIRRPGRPPLLAAELTAAPLARGKALTPAALRRSGRARARTVSVPMFIGLRRVHIPKRFSLMAIFDRAGITLRLRFQRNLSEADGTK